MIIRRFPSISFVTACMGRLHNLKETLFYNLNWNYKLRDVEFVILNYNSNDNLNEWMHENMIDFINDKRISYYRYYDSNFFRMSHSKNILLRLAKGDIICFLDADNFTGKDFGLYILKNLTKNNFLTACDYNLNRDSFQGSRDGYSGRLAIYRNNLLKIGGFYESSSDAWGYDDLDAYYRLYKMAGFQPKLIDTKYLFCIPNSDDERIKNFDFNIKSTSPYDTLEDSFMKIEVECRSLYKSGNPVLNKEGFGKGIVYKGFSDEKIYLR